ncbi:hypothetical protein [Streptomyces sp. NPDC002516]
MTSREIRFDCGRHADRGVLEVVPRVDGVPLTALIDHFGTGARMRPAGGAHGGLLPQFFRFGRRRYDHAVQLLSAAISLDGT